MGLIRCPDGTGCAAEGTLLPSLATSLLVPPIAAGQATLDPRGLYGLASRYDVSSRVAAWAIARARPSVTLLWLRHAPHPVRGGLETMRVEWGASERFVARGESFKSPLAELGPGERGHATQTLRLAGREEAVGIDAWRFDTSTMLAVIQPSSSLASDVADAPQPRLV